MNLYAIKIAYENPGKNIRFSSLFAAEDVSRGEEGGETDVFAGYEIKKLYTVVSGTYLGSCGLLVGYPDEPVTRYLGKRAWKKKTKKANCYKK